MTTKQYDNYADLITFTRASSGTYLDSDGLLKTATTNTPRIEYDADGNRLGLLIEEARTNTMIRSEEFDNTQWSKVSVGNGLAPVVTANAGVSPDGATTADRIVFDAVDSAGQSQVNNLSATALTGICTFSVWLKAETGTPTVFLRIDWFGNAVIENVTLTNEWQRYSVTMPSSASAATGVNRGQFGTRPALGTSTSANVFAWGAQLEAGSFPTSYIGTAGVAATRAADVASIPTSAFGYNPDKGTVVVDYSTFTSEGTTRIAELETDEPNRLTLFQGATGEFVDLFVKTGGATIVNITTANSATAGGTKLAIAYAADDYVICLDGGALNSDTSGAVPPVDNLKLGSSNAAGALNGYLKSIQYFPRRLTNAQLQELTA